MTTKVKTERKTLILTNAEYKSLSRMFSNAFEFERFGLDVRWSRTKGVKRTCDIEVHVGHNGGIVIEHERHAPWPKPPRGKMEKYDSTAAFRCAYESWFNGKMAARLKRRGAKLDLEYARYLIERENKNEQQVGA